MRFLLLAFLFLVGCDSQLDKVYHAQCWSGGEPVYSEMVFARGQNYGQPYAREVASGRRVKFHAECILIEMPELINQPNDN